MKFVDALRLMGDGNIITRNGRTFVKNGDKYRFTFVDKLSNKWYVDNFKGRSRRFGETLRGIKYGCSNCRKCKNETQCPNHGYCYLYDKDKAPHPHKMPKTKD